MTTPPTDRTLPPGEALAKLFMDNADRGANAANDDLIEQLQRRIRALRKICKDPDRPPVERSPRHAPGGRSVPSRLVDRPPHREDGMHDEGKERQMLREPVGFADDPVASHSAQFGLGRPMGSPVGRDVPSSVGVRPWYLRGAQVMDGGGARLGAWRYDHARQIAVTFDGRLVREIVAAAPTAKSVTNLDGDEGKSEDWTYDFCPDESGNLV